MNNLNPVKTASFVADRVEVISAVKRCYFRRAWRVVDNATGLDLIQPWPYTKGEARVLAKHLGIKITKEEK